MYEDTLRASWPVKKAEAGKYYKPDWTAPVEDVSKKFPELKRISRAREYEVLPKQNPVTIDGKLTREEWLGLDKGKAMIIEEEHLTGIEQEGVRSRAWLLYDDEYLYLGFEHMPDILKEGVPEKMPVVTHEFAVEGCINANTWWWQEGLPTGPLYVFSGKPDGRFVVHNIFNMPDDVIAKLQKAVEYAAVMLDSENYHWTAEWKIPLDLLNININDKNSVMFNTGVIKRTGWFAWVATGSSIWRADNAGSIKFVK